MMMTRSKLYMKVSNLKTHKIGQVYSRHGKGFKDKKIIKYSNKSTAIPALPFGA